MITVSVLEKASVIKPLREGLLLVKLFIICLCVVGGAAAHQVVQVPAAYVPTGREDESL